MINLRGVYFSVCTPPGVGGKNLSFHWVWGNRMKKKGKREKGSEKEEIKREKGKRGKSSAPLQPLPQQTSWKSARASETCKIDRFLNCGFGEKILFLKGGGGKNISVTTNIYPCIVTDQCIKTAFKEQLKYLQFKEYPLHQKPCFSSEN